MRIVEHQIVPVSAIASFEDSNVSRDQGAMFTDFNEQVALANCLVDGWKEHLGRIAVVRLSSEMVATAVDELENRRKLIEDQREDIPLVHDGKKLTASPSDMLRVFDAMYYKKGKPIKPEFENVNCFRRLHVLPLAWLIAFKLGKPYPETVPVTIYEFESEQERVDLCVSENAEKRAGQRLLGPLDMLRAAKAMLACFVREIRFRECFGPGNGQKLYALCRLMNEYPSLDIENRIRWGYTETGPADQRIIYAKLSKEEMRKLLERAAPAEDVDAYLRDPKITGEVGQIKMASRKDIQAVANGAKADVLKAVVTGFLKNDLSPARVVNERAAELNAVWNANPDQRKLIQLLTVKVFPSAEVTKVFINQLENMDTLKA